MAQQSVPRQKVNRVPELLAELQEYWFHGGQVRFARDAGVSESTFSRIVRGQARNPRFRDICRINALFEKKLGRKIDPRELYQVGEGVV